MEANDSRPGVSSTIVEAMRGYGPRDLPRAITDYLTVKALGRGFPVTAKQIEHDLGIKPDKSIARVAIHNLRKKGVLIASGSRGYWILGPMPSWEDVKAFLGCIGSLRRRAVEIIETTKPMGRELNRKFGRMIRSHSPQKELGVEGGDKNGKDVGTMSEM